jgi:hypothetical protein
MFVVLAILAGCGSGAEPFRLAFEATAQGRRVDCTHPVEGLGADGTVAVGPSDLRFYVSNLVLRDDDGDVVEATLDENDFQLTADAGWVGLVDLTDNSTGTCSGTSVAYSEGTARTNDAITGETNVGRVAAV